MDRKKLAINILLLIIGSVIGASISVIYLSKRPDSDQIAIWLLTIVADSVAPLVSIITLGFGGLIATILWWLFRKPDLSLGPDPSTERFDPDVQRTLRHRIQVSNNGVNAAKNCKAKLQLEGKLDGELFRVENHLPWAQGGNTISINSEETALIDVMVVTNDPSLNDEGRAMVQFLSGLPYEEYSAIESYRLSDGDMEFDEVFHELPANELVEADMSRKSLIVTAENTGSIEIPLEFTEGRPITIEVNSP